MAQRRFCSFADGLIKKTPGKSLIIVSAAQQAEGDDERHYIQYISWSASCVLNVCHSSLKPTTSIGAISTLGRVINAYDALNLGCLESPSVRWSGT